MSCKWRSDVHVTSALSSSPSDVLSDRKCVKQPRWKDNVSLASFSVAIQLVLIPVYVVIIYLGRVTFYNRSCASWIELYSTDGFLRGSCFEESVE